MSSDMDEKDKIVSSDSENDEIESKGESEVLASSSEDTSFDDLSVIDISSDVEYKLNQERSGIEVVKLDKNKNQRTNVNSFDLFFIRLWAAIVSAVTYVSQGICKGFFKVFKRELPQKYVTATIALLLIILLIIIVLAPFNLTVGDKNTVEIFSNSLVPVQNGDGLWGYTNKHGRMVIPCKYKDANPFYNGVAFVKNEEDTWILIGTNGKQKGKFSVNSDASDPDKQVVGDFNNSAKRAWVYDIGGYYFINTSGKKVFGGFDKVESFSEGYAVGTKGTGQDTETSFYTPSGKAKGSYQDAKSFSEGIAAVKSSGSWMFIDKNFKVISDKYSNVTSFKNGYAWVRINQSVNLIDKKGRLVLKDDYAGMKPSDEELRELGFEVYK